MFRRGPLVAAYPRFPSGLTSADLQRIEDPHVIAAALRRSSVGLLRFSAPLPLPAAWVDVRSETTLAETQINNLESWQRSTLSTSVRRKFRKGDSAGLRMIPAEANDGAKLYTLYARSISRQGGRLRYPPAYFDALCLASTMPGGPTVGKAVIRQELAAFVAVLHLDRTSYYLHGGYIDRFAALRPGYTAMAWAIETSRDLGSGAFNFLTSPADQPALLSYKESFGGTSGQRVHWQQPLTPLGAVAAMVVRLGATWKRFGTSLQAFPEKKTSA
ncbi:MAG: GNAT family N-acetyltransferase [Lysobacteraceae bacterium]